MVTMKMCDPKIELEGGVDYLYRIFNSREFTNCIIFLFSTSLLLIIMQLKFTKQKPSLSAFLFRPEVLLLPDLLPDAQY